MKKIILIIFLLASVMQAQSLLMEFGSKPNYTWVEQLGDSNKFYTDTGDWTLHGSGSITRNADSSLTFESLDIDTYIALPYQPTQNQVHELSFDYEEGETDVITNGDFANGSTGWTLNQTVVSGGVATITCSGYISSSAANWEIYQQDVFDLVSKYKVVFDARKVSGVGELIVGANYTNTFFGYSLPSTFSEYSFETTPTIAGRDDLCFGGTSGTVFEIKNIRLYKISSESQSIESAKLIYSINNQTDSTNTVSSSYQTATKNFIGGSTDTLKISLSDTAKVKIKNPSIKLRVKQ